MAAGLLTGTGTDPPIDSERRGKGKIDAQQMSAPVARPQRRQQMVRESFRCGQYIAWRDWLPAASGSRFFQWNDARIVARLGIKAGADCARTNDRPPPGETSAPQGGSMVSFTLNDGRYRSMPTANTPLLWVIRDHVGLTGTKYGCGAGLCGACTVHVDGKAVRACQTQVSEVTNKKVVTIEGLSPELLASAAEGLGRAGGTAMRLLPVRPDHEGGRAACHQQAAEPRADRRAYGRQHLPLRHLPPHHRRGRTGFEGGLSHDDCIDKDPKSPAAACLPALGGMTFCLAFGTDGVQPRLRGAGQHHGECAGHAVGAGRARRHHHHPERRRRDGPGLDDQPADDRGGGDGRRLVEGRDRDGARRRRCLRLHDEQQPAHDGDRRQPRHHALLRRSCAPPARRCAR